MSFIHSILEAGKKKHNPEKKTAFSFIQSKSLKNAQKRTYPGKKKYGTFGSKKIKVIAPYF